MKNNIFLVLALGAVAAAAAGTWVADKEATQPAPAPVQPLPKPEPDPDCPDGKCPPRRPKPRPWGTETEASVGGPQHADGTELLCDLPSTLHQKNTGGSDGSGLCVFASMRHSGLWADEPVFTELFGWMKKHPGGGYPQKVDQMVARYCQEKGTARPSYVQVEDADLAILRQACAAGLMPGVTYWRSPTGRYGGKQISHMVSLVHADDRHFAILDNNFVGSFEWMSPTEFKKAYTGNTGKGWAIIPLKPGPPPVPHPAQPPTEKEIAMQILLPALALTAALTLPDPAGYEWKPWPGGRESALLKDGAQVGAWNALAGYYRALNPDGTWGPKLTSAPVQPPLFDGGVDGSHLSKAERYTLNGKAIPRQEAIQAIENAKLPDLAGKLRLTLIGGKQETAPVLADLRSNPALAPFVSNLVIAAYEPSHWHVAQAGFATGGKPTLYLQDETGQVLHRQDDYADGPAGLAATLGKVTKLRKPDPRYDPTRDIDRRKKSPLATAARMPATLLILGGLAASAYWFTRRKNP